MSAIFSTSLDARTLRTVEVLTGGIPAEFGDKLAGVINVNTRSGLEGPTQGGISFSGGSLSTGEAAADFSTHTRKLGFLTNLSASTSQRFLDPPTLDNFHNFGRTGKAFFRLDYQFDAKTACAARSILAARIFRCRTVLRRNSPARINDSNCATTRRTSVTSTSFRQIQSHNFHSSTGKATRN
jgi:outer membrane receptor protein involved in Fe transport